VLEQSGKSRISEDDSENEEMYELETHKFSKCWVAPVKRLIGWKDRVLMIVLISFTFAKH
jgi:hypothetical protein